MAIERILDEYIPVCDMCMIELPEELSFEDAVEGQKRNGWRSVQDPSGAWWSLCPECYSKHANRLRGIGPSEFEGIA